MNLPSSLSIRTRLLLILSLSVICVAIVSLASLFNLRHNLMADRELKTRHVVETAHGILAAFQAQAARGEIGEAEAKSRAIAVLRGLRYGDKEYFWINDMQPRMVMHPVKPELEGQDLSGKTDPDGKKLFVSFVETVKANQEGFVQYRWPKPGSQEPVPKLSFVKGFAPWGWVVGSGIYIDDVDQVFWREATEEGLAAAVILLILAGVLYQIGRGIVGPVETLGRAMTSMRDDHDLTIQARLTGRDEIARMAEAFNALLIYIASADKQFAILGDTAIFQLAPADFWNQQSQALAGTFREGRFKYGICQCIEQCGNLLATYFPPRENQKNELPDEIIFGK